MTTNTEEREKNLILQIFKVINKFSNIRKWEKIVSRRREIIQLGGGAADSIARVWSEFNSHFAYFLPHYFNSSGLIYNTRVSSELWKIRKTTKNSWRLLERMLAWCGVLKKRKKLLLTCWNRWKMNYNEDMKDGGRRSNKNKWKLIEVKRRVEYIKSYFHAVALVSPINDIIT